MEIFYRGFTIKTTMMTKQMRGFTLWRIYARKGIVRGDNRPIMKGIVKDYRGPENQARKNIDALLCGTTVFTKYRQNYGRSKRAIRLTEEQINLILVDEIFHEVCKGGENAGTED